MLWAGRGWISTGNVSEVTEFALKRGHQVVSISCVQEPRATSIGGHFREDVAIVVDEFPDPEVPGCGGVTL